MSYYNAVLLPPEKVSKDIIEFVNVHYLDISDGYCLGDNALPHITLCQFKCDEFLGLEMVEEEIKTPKFTQSKIREGRRIHDGFDWMELSVKPENWLMELARKIRGEIISFGGEALTQTYNPHLTLCRVPSGEIEKFEFPMDVVNDKNKWKFAVGKSDINGQFYG